MFYTSVITGNCVNSSTSYRGLMYAARCTQKSKKYVKVLTSNVELMGISLGMVAVAELRGAVTLKCKP